MARHRKLTQKFAGFPMFKLATGGDTYPLTSPFTSDFVGLDGLALDLQFAADKTLTARKGPTPVFTRGSSGTFVGSNGLIQSAGTNVARFDHDPITLACKGLLIEESRTNICLYSDNFRPSTSGNYWNTISASTVTVDQIASPSGSIDADLLSSSTTAFDCFTRRLFSWAASTQYSYSVFVKRGPSNHRYVGFFHGVQNGSVQATYFDFDNPTVINVPAGQVGVINLTSVTAYPNGWYRINIAFVTHTTPIGPYFGVFLSTSTGTQVSGVGGLDVYIWGIQVELGSFPTSYIPTTTASVIRSADVCSISGSAFSGMYNQPEGTLFADVTPTTVNQSATVVTVNTTTFNNTNGIYKTDSTSQMSGKRWGGLTNLVGNNPQAAILTSTDVAVSRSNLAYAYKSNDFAFAYAGTIVGTDTSGTLPSSTSMRIGSRDDGLFINGHLASVRYYKKRLPNAKLASLTV